MFCLYQLVVWIDVLLVVSLCFVVADSAPSCHVVDLVVRPLCTYGPRLLLNNEPVLLMSGFARLVYYCIMTRAVVLVVLSAGLLFNNDPRGFFWSAPAGFSFVVQSILWFFVGLSFFIISRCALVIGRAGPLFLVNLKTLLRNYSEKSKKRAP